ncbi:MAG: DegQ family serine endoprotease [Gammaproteobacteria bacterium]|nr:DegQ family serine endoprotease [Gammaproteobacteria bacterium]
MNFYSNYIFRFILIMTLSVPLLVVHAALPDFTRIVEQAKDSVVNISTKTKARKSRSIKGPSIPDFPEGSPFGELFEKFFDHENPRERRRGSQSLGSGFIISKDGYILTNHHVIAGADEVLVRLANREEYVARIVGSDEASDIAVLKVDADNLPTLKFGDSDDLKVGEWVLAIGSPFGFDHSVTAGIVSAKGRNLPSDNYVPFIQTDVAINPGNSGGPLFNLDGEVVGINSQIYSRTGGFMGLSFAIPIELAVDVANQIKLNGRVSRGWLGVLIQEVTRDLAESFGMDSPQGALVAKVLENSPAKDAGLQVGDVIVEFNGRKVMRSSSLPPLVGRSAVGKDAQVTIIRNRSREKIKVRIAELPDSMTRASFTTEDDDRPIEKSALGMNVIELSESARKKLRVQSGVEVTEVDDTGSARDAGILKGDVITMIDNLAVDSVDDFDAITNDLKAGKSVALLVQRRSGPVFLAIRPEDS